MPGEFNLIDKYFAHRQANRKDVDLALGDDCALVSPPDGYQIAISTDTVVLGTHFLADADPAAVAYKALMSNISDLAAMGATPAWFSMAISLPEIDEAWLAPFCDAMFELADAHNLQLIGGDTTKGPLSISFTIQGVVPKGQALTRSGAQVGDWVFVSGNLGDSQAGLSVILNPDDASKPHAKELVLRHFYAQSRIKLAERLRHHATSCIDISDGLMSDLKHVLKRSKVSAQLDIASLPITQQATEFYGDKLQAQLAALKSGEEYELCFTVASENKAALNDIADKVGCQLTCIGRIIANAETSLCDITLVRNGVALSDDDPAKQAQGFDHFN
ncbi:thiamine-phosphate kinase [Vibrio litoralis]|uniref:thiamine-phosphate kinase n=1 Tax=Vibrio litoralis TaxID=335972 RepID=UPI0004207818|nr:thiamine-phosphate kinase [Vibrio litoralis]